jgi:hypothetical protein
MEGFSYAIVTISNEGNNLMDRDATASFGKWFFEPDKKGDKTVKIRD